MGGPGREVGKPSENRHQRWAPPSAISLFGRLFFSKPKKDAQEDLGQIRRQSERHMVKLRSLLLTSGGLCLLEPSGASRTRTTSPLLPQKAFKGTEAARPARVAPAKRPPNFSRIRRIMENRRTAPN